MCSGPFFAPSLGLGSPSNALSLRYLYMSETQALESRLASRQRNSQTIGERRVGPAMTFIGTVGPLCHSESRDPSHMTQSQRKLLASDQ